MIAKHVHLAIHYRKESLSQSLERLSLVPSTMVRNQIENVDIKKDVGLHILPMMKSFCVILQGIQIRMILYSAVFASKVSSVEVRDLPSSLNVTMYSASRVQSHGTKISKEENRCF